MSLVWFFAASTKRIFFFKTAHYWGDASSFQCFDILLMSSMSVRPPGLESRKVKNFSYFVKSWIRERLNELSKINPFKVRNAKVGHCVVKIESINKAFNPSTFPHLHPRNTNP